MKSNTQEKENSQTYNSNKESNLLNELPPEILPEGYNQYDLSFKIIVLGDSGVGKSCLTMKGVKNIYHLDTIPTVGFEFFTFSVKIENVIVKLQIWDTCGQEVYKSLVANFYRNSSLAIIVYSIDNRGSFEDLSIWLKELKTNSNPEIKLILLGNKCDLENRQVTKEEGMRYKEENNFDLFMETSAKIGSTPQDIFIEAAKMLKKDFKKFADDNFSEGSISRKNSAIKNANNNLTNNKTMKRENTHQYSNNERLPGKDSFLLKKKDREEGASRSCKC